MLLNSGTAIVTPKVLLVPYSAHHVLTYHNWMLDEKLQELTASEPLSLKEEYAMQRSWRNDADKLTFIVCRSSASLANKREAAGELRDEDDACESMIGDVNLFLYQDADADDDDDESHGSAKVVGELEIMIAVTELHGKGYGQAALLTFMWYILRCQGAILTEFYTRGKHPRTRTTSMDYLRVRIGRGNTRSIRLFEKVGFRKASEEPNYFGELELRWMVNGKDSTALLHEAGDGSHDSRAFSPRVVSYRRVE